MIKCRINSLLVAFLLLLPSLVFALPGPHDPDTGTYSVACNDCHVYPNTIGSTNLKDSTNICYKCHRLDSYTDTAKKFKVNDFADIDDTSSSLSGRNKPLKTSHKWIGTDVNTKAKAKAPVDTSAGGLNKKGLPGYMSCVRCHSVHGTAGDSSNIAPYLRYVNDRDEMCMNCHRDRANSTAVLGSHPVTISYTSASAKAKTGQFIYSGANRNPYRNVVNPTAEMKNKKGFVVCTSCHGVHVADSNSSTSDTFTAAALGQLSSSDGSLLRVSRRGADNSQSTVNICTNCHIKQHSGQMKQHTKSVVIQCMDCHNAHVDTILASDPIQTPNKYLLRRYVNYSGIKNSVVNLSTYRKRLVYTEYTTTGAGAKWARADGTGVCQACHALPNTVADHTNFTSRKTCQNCHTTAPHTDSIAQGGCTTCHGTPPVSLATTADARSFGGALYSASGGDESTAPHSTHASGGSNYSFACNQCHNGYDTAPIKHQDGQYNDGVFVTKVAVGTDSIISGLGATYSGGNCTTVYCHSDGTSTTSLGSAKTEAWAGGLNHITTCDACHAASPATGDHNKHTVTKGYGCVTCHAGTVSDNSTISSKSKHVNAVKDVQFSQTTPAVGATCATVYCHSNGAGAAPVTVPVWGTASTGYCDTCHRTATTPSGIISTGAHFAHISSSYGPKLNTNSFCNSCHVYTLEVSATHVNGTIDKYATGATLCQNCHAGSVPTTTWATPAAGVTCQSCHSGRGNGGTDTPASRSWSTYNATGVQAPFKSYTTFANRGHGQSGFGSIDCKTCHDEKSRHITGVLGDSRRLSSGQDTSSVSGFAGNNNLCNTCHAAGQSAATKIRPTHIGTHGEGTASMQCAQCHDTHGTANQHMVAKAISFHPNSSAYTINYATDSFIQTVYPYRGLCQVCHTATTHFRRGQASFDSSGWSVSHSGFNGTTNCLTCHPHGTGVTSASNYAFKPSASTCDGCHGYPPVPDPEGFVLHNNYSSARMQNYSGGGGVHAIAAHLSPTIKASTANWATDCNKCHFNTDHSMDTTQWTVDKTTAQKKSKVNVLVDPQYIFNSSKTLNEGRYVKSASDATGTCSNVSCHFKPTNTWSTEK